METIPTAAVGRANRDDLLLQIELTKWQWKLEIAKTENKKLDTGQRQPNISNVAPSTPFGETTPTQQPTPLEGKGRMDPGQNQSQTFEKWLEKDKRARRTLLAIGKGGRYNAEKKNIQGSWVVAFREGIEIFSGKAHVVTDEDKQYVERLRKKCTTTPAWNYGRVYKSVFKDADPLKLFQQPLPRELSPELVETTVHSQFKIAGNVRIIGKRRNISPLASDDDNNYYIAKGSVLCSGIRTDCRCSESCIRLIVMELFPHDGPLQRFTGTCQEEIPTHVIRPDRTLEWRQSLVRLMPKENIREKTKPRKTVSNKGGKENEVRKSTREPKYSSKIIEILDTGLDYSGKRTTVGAKRGRKRKVGAPVRTIEASKPVTSVVERPGKRQTTKLALN